MTSLEPNTSLGDSGPLPWRLVPTEGKALSVQGKVHLYINKRQGRLCRHTAGAALRASVFIPICVQQQPSRRSCMAWPVQLATTAARQQTSTPNASKTQQLSTTQAPVSQARASASPFTSQSQSELFRCYNFDPAASLLEITTSFSPQLIPGLDASTPQRWEINPR